MNEKLELKNRLKECRTQAGLSQAQLAEIRIINAAEAAEILDCSRQYINELVRTRKLHPIKASGKNTLFLKSEVLQRNWQ